LYEEVSRRHVYVSNDIRRKLIKDIVEEARDEKLVEAFKRSNQESTQRIHHSEEITTLTMEMEIYNS
jgi:hypothetical protein